MTTEENANSYNRKLFFFNELASGVVSQNKDCDYTFKGNLLSRRQIRYININIYVWIDI